MKTRPKGTALTLTNHDTASYFGLNRTLPLAEICLCLLCFATETETPAAIKFYLAAYNVVSALGWSYVFVTTVIHLFDLDNPKTSPAFLVNLARSIPYFPPASRKYLKLKHVEALLPGELVPFLRRATTTYARVGFQTAVIQTLAVMEVIHSLLGFVRSPLSTTAMQVSSRYFLVWGIANVFKTVSVSHHPSASLRFNSV